jgi:polyhydroxyalkanoate synthase subunit PhaE
VNELFQAWGESQKRWIEALQPGKPRSSEAASTGASVSDGLLALPAAWRESIEKWTEVAQRATVPKALTPDLLRSMFSPEQWSGAGAGVFDTSLQQALEGPRLATLWTLDRKLLELQASAQRRDRAAAQFQSLVQGAWANAYQRFVAAQTQPGAEAATSWRALADRWLSQANETLGELHRSQAFLDAQRELMRSASEHRLQERAVAEGFCEANHIPTRSEVDEVHRTVTELRRQLRQLQAAAALPTRRAVREPESRDAVTSPPVRSKSKRAQPAARTGTKP